VQIATAQSKSGTFHGYGVSEARSVFKPAGLTVCFSLSLFGSVADLEFSTTFLYLRGHSAVSELSSFVLLAHDQSHKNCEILN
jgi:hypothetical protein